MKPLVSVIIPMYNAENYISATLASILQEHSIPLEVIVVNDQSTDNSLSKIDAIQDKRIKIIEGSKKGIATALNAGLAQARGEIIMRCDADDLYSSQRIATQVEWLHNNPEFGAICGAFSTIDIKGNLIAKLNTKSSTTEITQELRKGITRTHLGTFAIRNEVLKKIGGFRSYFKTGEDIDFQLRLAEVCRVWYLSENYYYYRLHNHSITHNINNAQREFFDSIARKFQQQRYIQGSDDLERGCPPPLPEGNNYLPMRAEEHIQGMLMGRAWKEHQAGRKIEALVNGWRFITINPSNLSAWRSLIALALKPADQKSKK